MELLSRKLAYRPETGCLEHYCPACQNIHIVGTHLTLANGSRWNWNQDADRPTFWPAIKITTSFYRDKEDPDFVLPATCCHYHIHLGVLTYFFDCTHAMAGKWVALPDLPNSYLDKIHD